MAPAGLEGPWPQRPVLRAEPTGNLPLDRGCHHFLTADPLTRRSILQLTLVAERGKTIDNNTVRANRRCARPVDAASRMVQQAGNEPSCTASARSSLLQQRRRI